MTRQQTTPAIEVLRPGDDGYDAASRTFVATGAPALVVRPRDPGEVAAALDHAARHGLAVSVRSGGHSPLGHGTNIGGAVIDLAHLDHVEILDPASRIVRVGGGASWGRVARALDSRGWAITAGDAADVGVGGLTLGGGFGWMVRRHGLAIDNLVGARVITADGRLLTASRDEHPELFWALRGGGGNFGVVVDFDFAASLVPTVHFGTVSYSVDAPSALLRRWRDAMRDAPVDLSSTLGFAGIPGAAPAATVRFCYVGEPGILEADVDRTLDPLVTLGTVTRATIAERRYAEILKDAAPRPGVQLVARNTLVSALDDAVIAAVDNLLAASPGPAMIAVRSLGGEFARVPSDATAFAHRGAEAMVVLLLMLPDAASDATVREALVPWGRVAARGIGTSVNFQGSATAEDLAAAYPPATRARLAAVKRTYDPDNRFARNHNIAPTPVERDRHTAA